jgi:hypothetical protein
MLRSTIGVFAAAAVLLGVAMAQTVSPSSEISGRLGGSVDLGALGLDAKTLDSKTTDYLERLDEGWPKDPFDLDGLDPKTQEQLRRYRPKPSVFDPGILQPSPGQIGLTGGGITKGIPRKGIPGMDAMPFPPGDGVGTLNGRERALLGACKGNDCPELAALRQVRDRLKASSRANPKCHAAATEYVAQYISGSVTQSVAAAFDLECFASAEPRAQASSTWSRDPLPAVLQSGGRAGSAPESPQGALRSIGLLEIDGKPYCGALLRNDHTLITARHCFEDTEGVAWKNNKVRIRPVDGHGGPWELETAFERQGAAGPKVADDWAVVAIRTRDAIGAAETELAQQTMPAEVTVVGYFGDHVYQSYGPDHSKDDWKLGLRWPKSGFCHVYMVQNKCLQMLCETVRGFSGTPVFDVAVSDPSKPLRVVGFISRVNVNPASGCGQPSPSVTVAAAADSVGP